MAIGYTEREILFKILRGFRGQRSLCLASAKDLGHRDGRAVDAEWGMACGVGGAGRGGLPRVGEGGEGGKSRMEVGCKNEVWRKKKTEEISIFGEARIMLVSNCDCTS